MRKEVKILRLYLKNNEIINKDYLRLNKKCKRINKSIEEKVKK